MLFRSSDIRRLEGDITRVIAYSAMMNAGVITLDLAIEALKDSYKSNITSKNKVQQIMQIVSNHYNISVDEIKSKKRVTTIAVPRQIAMYICRVKFDIPFSKIGVEFGGKTHTTVMHSVNKIEKELKKDQNLENVINKLTNEVSV